MRTPTPEAPQPGGIRPAPADGFMIIGTCRTDDGITEIVFRRDL